MSAEATGWVWTNSPYRNHPRKFIIHLAVADVVNDAHGHQFWMSNARLAEKVHSSRQYVNAVLREMVDRGMLRIITTDPYGRVVYQFRYEVSDQQTPPAADPVRSADTPLSAHDTPPVRSADTELKKNSKGTQTLSLIASDEGRKNVVHEKVDELFAEFWTAYPRKVDKIPTRKAWDRLFKDCRTVRSVEALSDRIAEAFNADPDMARDDKQFIPYPASWLRKQRWEDAS